MQNTIEALRQALNLSASLLLVVFIGRLGIGCAIYAHYHNTQNAQLQRLARDLAKDREKLGRTLAEDLVVCFVGVVPFFLDTSPVNSFLNLALELVFVLNLLLDIYLHRTIFRGGWTTKARRGQGTEQEEGGRQ